VHEETGYEVSASIIPLGVSYTYALLPLADRWRARYGPGVTEISVVAFGAEAPAAVEPVLDPAEHDSYAWCTYEQAYALLDWPIESDALPAPEGAEHTRRQDPGSADVVGRCCDVGGPWRERA
jgi:8-oxo-dGTP pyrophosphatase MutT (NUDIX family)